ncbi:mercuric resistance transcriptional repressor protein MerD (plasmid) [Stutzerimonas stutzeri]|uniref:mercuric resistance transcriptional repressor MerD n=1 Tax=Stutzerimonas stutzeri TaxID=316 RepID=UPI001C4AD2A3|nr:mercuric resistance transcriptional repressor MerD [Stutzerimonas stutzeri]QXP27899.1 mercuric resistance transcriptional repressor protein MerD [Stutzerimonas stutzeri]
MNAYSISKLADDACVSVHVVRNYMIRGLLHPARRTESGYNIFDDKTLGRLRFLRTAFESRIGLDELTRLCKALDAGDCESVNGCVERLRGKIDARRIELSVVETSLNQMVTGASTTAMARMPRKEDRTLALGEAIA